MTKKTEKVDEQTGLTARQFKAAFLSANGVDTPSVVKELGVDRSTLWRWRQEPTYVVEYERCLREAKEDLRRRFARLQEKALEALESALDGADSRTAFRAAQYVLDNLSKVETKDYDLRQEIRLATRKEEQWSLSDLDLSYFGYDADKYSEICERLGITENLPAD